MPALGFPPLFALLRSRKCHPALAPPDHSSIRVSRAMQTLSLVALFVALASCARAAYGATFTVTDASDNASDSGSLRYAVNNAADGDTITFANSVVGTITLTNGPLVMNANVTMQGPGATLLTISGNNVSPVFQIYAAGTVNLSGLTIANGNDSQNGGGIDHIFTTGTLAVDACAFYSNTTVAGGGAIANGSGTLLIQNSTFSGNSSEAGGAIFNNAGTMTIENTTLYNNNVLSGGPGGGIFNTGTMSIDSSTVSGNQNGGIFDNSGSPTTISNSIVAGNSVYDCDNCGTLASNNMIGGSPDLGPLQFNGGGTKTMMPLPGSPAIGAGSGNTLTTDQRGFARPTSGRQRFRRGANQLSNCDHNRRQHKPHLHRWRDVLSARRSQRRQQRWLRDIIFQSGLTGSITLTGILPSITADTNIAGPGAQLMTISANGATRR